MMKRSLPLLTIGLLALASCANTSAYPPEEVLRRAVTASGQLQSASFAVQLSFSVNAPGMTGAGGATVNGVLQDGGNAVQFTVDGKGSLTQGDQQFTANVNADVVSDRDRDTYFNIHSLSLTPPYPLLSDEAIQSLIGTWWKTEAEKNAPVIPVSPDPGLLRAQSEVVKVTRDRGIETFDDHESYHYDVTLDADKMIAFLAKQAEAKNAPFDEISARADLAGYDAKGELWIDAETYAMDKIVWNVGAGKGAKTPYAFAITVTMDNQNSAPAVRFPENAKPFPGLQSLMTMPGLPAASSSSTR